MEPHQEVFAEGDVEFLALKDAPEATVDEFYALLEDTFPANELESLEDLKGSLNQNANGLLALLGGRVAGGLVYEHYVEGTVQLLGYLVVSRSMRSRGLGTRLLRRGMAPSADVLALGEIEDPRYWPVTDDNDPGSRLRFWAREGCKLLPLAYAQPALGSDNERVPHLLLIAVPRGHEPLPERVSGPSVATFLREYYLASEGSIAEDDSELQKLLAACSVEQLPLWPMDRLDAADGAALTSFS
jgi:GNAT superfamily N-acetyltransferase